MKAEFSNNGFMNADRYTALHLMEGRMLTDRDANGLTAMLQASQRALGTVSFNNGVPKKNGILTDFNGDTARLSPMGGAVVAGGIVAIAKPSNSDTDFSFSNQRDLPEMNFTEGFLYVDIFKDSVCALEDPDLFEPALHGADTRIAERQYVQIKIANESSIIESDCGRILDLPKIGNGEFSIEWRETNIGPDQCDPCASEVSVEQEVPNKFFRMEVHKVEYDNSGKPIKVTLKWSGENGGMVFPQTATQDINDTNHSYEYFIQDTQCLMGLPATGFGGAVQATNIFHGSQANPFNDLNALVRRWDGFAVIDLQGSTVTGWDGNQQLNLPDGTRSVQPSADGFIFRLETLIVTLDLDGKDILVGDYWLALQRTATGTVRALSKTPNGIKHEYCVLGYSVDGVHISGISPADLNRLQSPDLSCLHAQDIRYAQNDCQFSDGATTVQEALDAFCAHIGSLYQAEQQDTSYPYITAIRYAMDNSAYQNDARTYSDRLASGLVFEFSETMRVDMISDDQIRLFMEFQSEQIYVRDQKSYRSQSVREVIIPGVVEGASDNRSVTFIPDYDLLRSAIDQANSNGPTPIRCRVEVLGQFILSTNGRPCDAQIIGRIVSEQVSPQENLAVSGGGAGGDSPASGNTATNPGATRNTFS